MADLVDRPVLAWSGLADNEKFFRTVESTGASLYVTRSFPDHHHRSDDEVADVLDHAEAHDYGIVTTAKGTAVKDCTVVLFAEDPQLWTVPGTRWVNAVRADQDGRFRFRNMPAGNYYAVALDAIEQGAWGDPELLERLRTQAKRTTLGEGQSATVDLKLADQQY